MAKGKNKVATRKLTIATTPKVIRYLQILVSRELHGKTETEVAEELIRYSIQQMIQNGRLQEVSDIPSQHDTSETK